MQPQHGVCPINSARVAGGGDLSLTGTNTAASEGVGSAFCAEDGVARAGPTPMSRPWGRVIASCSRSLSSPGFAGTDSPFRRGLGYPHLCASPRTPHALCSALWLGRSPGVCHSRRGTYLCWPSLHQPRSVARADLWAEFRARPQPIPTSPASKVGPREAGLQDQSVRWFLLGPRQLLARSGF